VGVGVSCVWFTCCRMTQKKAWDSLYNTLWLIANDVIIGTSLAALLCQKNQVIAVQLERIMQVGSANTGAPVLCILRSFLILVIGVRCRRHPRHPTVAQRLASRPQTQL
jgi:uncharacterized membrane protein